MKKRSIKSAPGKLKLYSKNSSRSFKITNLENNLLHYIATQIQSPQNKLKFKVTSKRLKQIPNNMNNINYKKGFKNQKKLLLKKHPILGIHAVRTVKTGMRNAKNNVPYYWYRRQSHQDSKLQLGQANAHQYFYNMGWKAVKGTKSTAKKI